MKKLSVILLFITITVTCKSQGVDSQCVVDGSGINCYPIDTTYTYHTSDTTKMRFEFWKGNDIVIEDGYNIFDGCETCISYRVDLNFQPFPQDLYFIYGESFTEIQKPKR